MSNTKYSKINEKLIAGVLKRGSWGWYSFCGEFLWCCVTWAKSLSNWAVKDTHFQEGFKGPILGNALGVMLQIVGTGKNRPFVEAQCKTSFFGSRSYLLQLLNTNKQLNFLLQNGSCQAHLIINGLLSST